MIGRSARHLSESTWESIMHSALDGFCEFDNERRFVDVNDAYCLMSGYTRDELLTMKVMDVEAEQSFEELKRRGRSLRGLGFARFETLNRHKDGHLFRVEVSSRFVPDGGGRFFSFVRDITDRTQAETQLREKTNELNQAQRLARMGSSLRDLRTNVIVWSDELYRMFDFDQTKPPPTFEEFCRLFSPESQAALADARKALFEQGRSFDLELATESAPGRPAWIRYSAEIERDQSGHPMRSRGTVQDITEQVLTTRALREGEERYRLMVETASEGISTIDKDGNLIFANAQMAAMFGYSVDELVGTNLLDHMREQDRPAGLERLERRRRGLGEQYDDIFRTKDGRDIRLLVNTSPLFDDRGHHIGSLGMATNITERTLLEERLRQAHKMEAIGRLAGGVAHDFNNLLLVINGYTDLLLDQVPSHDSARAKLTEIRKAGQSAQELTSRLLAFSRKQLPETETLSLNAVVGDIQTILQRVIGEDIRIVTAFSEELGYVRGDRTEMTQILMNLSVNARDAMPRGGTLTFRTANVDIDEHYTRTHPDSRTGAFVLLSVIDTGTGMDARTLEHVFEPFYTTKDQGKGTGLGLATVYGMVSQSGGWISARSHPGQGATFQIYLPRVAAPVPVVDEGPRAGAGPGGSETILVVEDQPDVRGLTCYMLGEMGYQVLSAASGHEALQLIESHRGPLDLVLSDVVMPEMGGRELAARLRAVRPTPVLFMSGYPGGTDRPRDAVLEYIRKPFTASGLGARVREVLEKKS